MRAPAGLLACLLATGVAADSRLYIELDEAGRAEQAAVYRASCARCHGDEGKGVEGPDEPSREGWQTLAAGVDRAIVDLNVSGQWAAEAEAALVDGDFEGLSPAFRSRIQWVGEHLSTLMGPLDDQVLQEGMCEIYREVTERA